MFGLWDKKLVLHFDHLAYYSFCYQHPTSCTLMHTNDVTNLCSCRPAINWASLFSFHVFLNGLLDVLGISILCADRCQ